MMRKVQDKAVVRDCGFSTAKALQELEHYKYRVHFSPEGTSIYEGYEDLQKLPNPLTYWRYHEDAEMEALPKVAKILYQILASSGVCEQIFIIIGTMSIFTPIRGCALMWGDLRS
jgi:hypothetical protein